MTAKDVFHKGKVSLRPFAQLLTNFKSKDFDTVALIFEEYIRYKSMIKECKKDQRVFQ